MKRFIIILSVMLLGISVMAEVPVNRVNKMPQGTFKKARNGKIIQYDNNGKKIGVYKLNNRGLVRVK